MRSTMSRGLGLVLSTVMAGAMAGAACSDSSDDVPLDPAGADASVDAADAGRADGAGEAREDASAGDDDDDASVVDGGSPVEDGGLSDASIDGSLDAGSDAGDASDASDAGTTVDLHDPAFIPTFELTIDAAAYAILSNPSTADADKKKWAKGTLKFGDEVLTDVGIRRKGSSTFRPLPQKAALKIRFDKYVDGRTFHGLHELTLNNMVSDGTFLAERLAYHVFRQMGLPAQKANTAHLIITSPSGTEDYGIYANVETPNEDFIASRFGAQGKTLFESNGGGTWTPGVEGNFDVQVGDDATDLTSLFQAVAAAKDASLLADMDARLDTAAWLKFSAVEGVVGMIDGYGYGIYGSHNYFLAGTTAAKFTPVPWSLDLTFSDNLGVVNLATPKPANPPPTGGTTLLMRCVAQPACFATYKATVAAALTTYEGLDLVNLAKTWHAQIDTLARADTKKIVANEGYEGETLKLYQWLAARPAKVRQQLGL